MAMGEKRGAREGEAGDGVGGTPCGPGEGACRSAICIHLYLEARPVDRLKGAPGLEIRRPQGEYRAEMGSSQSGEGGHRGGRAQGPGPGAAGSAVSMYVCVRLSANHLPVCLSRIKGECASSLLRGWSGWECEVPGSVESPGEGVAPACRQQVCVSHTSTCC